MRAVPERVPSLELEPEEEAEPLPEAPERAEKEKVPAIVFAKPGEIYEAKVTAIYRGRMADFYDIESIEDEQLKERLRQIMDDPAFEVRFYIPKLGIELRDVIRVSFHDKAKYVEIGRCYGQISEGDKIYVELNPKGRARIVCPPRTINP